MSRQDALEWCDQNMHNNYPLTDSATATATDGTALPSSFLVDFQLILENTDMALGENVEERFFVSSIYESAGSLYVEVSFQDAEGPVLCCRSDAIDLGIGNTDLISERTIRLHPVRQEEARYRNLTSARGFIIIGSCADMQSVAELLFDYEAGELISTRVYDIATDSEPNEDTFDITEYLTIKPGLGIEFDVDETWYNNVKYTVLTINRVVPADIPYLNAFELAQYLNSKLPTVISTINGIAPDSNGNFAITGTDCVSVSGAKNGIVLSNSCAKPCCDKNDRDLFDKELEAVEEAQDRLETALKEIATNLEGMHEVVKGLVEQEGGSYNEDKIPESDGEGGGVNPEEPEPGTEEPTPEPDQGDTPIEVGDMEPYTGILVCGIPFQPFNWNTRYSTSRRLVSQSSKPVIQCRVHRDSTGKVTFMDSTGGSDTQASYLKESGFFNSADMSKLILPCDLPGYNSGESGALAVTYVPYKTANISNTPTTFTPDLRAAFIMHLKELGIYRYVLGYFPGRALVDSELLNLYVPDTKVITFVFQSGSTLFAYDLAGRAHSDNWSSLATQNTVIYGYKLNNNASYQRCNFVKPSAVIENPKRNIVHYDWEMAYKIAYDTGSYNDRNWGDSFTGRLYDIPVGFHFPSEEELHGSYVLD